MSDQDVPRLVALPPALIARMQAFHTTVVARNKATLEWYQVLVDNTDTPVAELRAAHPELTSLLLSIDTAMQAAQMALVSEITKLPPDFFG